MNLTIDSIYYEKDGHQILCGVFLKAHKGEVLGVLGRNGSGKSTLFQIIFGALKPSFGNIYIDGVKRKRGYQDKIIKFLPQAGFLPGHLSVAQTLNLFEQKWSKSDFLEIGLDLTEQLKIAQLSFGQKKIFECALILKSPSPIILLDEPFAGVGPLNIEFIQSLIQSKSSSKLILITDHKYREILKASDRLLMISSGQAKAIEMNKRALELNGYLSEIDFKLST
ncbi:MAG: ABC-type multidrug transport system ATPase subunit [Roseivirga sp.]|jgi:ABC-type multidrug transport system ATPase subunit